MQKNFKKLIQKFFISKFLYLFLFQNNKENRYKMPKNDSDDENDSCVLLGTPLVDLLPGW
jgi:hypothetical protein